MILLNGQSLAIKDRFPVESMPLNLEERNSNATITVGPDAPGLAINDWLKDETEPGAGIIWRVKTVNEQAETRTRTIQLEHPIQILKDYALFGEATPKTITGNNSATVCTSRQAIIWALGRQSIWQLGDLEENPSNPYSFNGESVFAALEKVTNSLDGCQWEYDLGTLPFTVHIRKAPADFSSEMRMSRNITSLRKQIDRSRMYTRHYPIGKNNLHIDGDYTSQNESLYGVIAKVETDQSLDTKEKLRAWSLERLKRHCEPAVTVTVGGLEMSQDTGEPLDHIVVGRKCRVPLPEYGTTILEKVTKISWADKIKDPEKVTITMANLIEDVASIVNSLASSSGRSGRAGAKNSEEDHAWFVDTTDKVQMVAEAIAGRDSDGKTNWSRVARLTVDGNGIDARVTVAEGKQVTMETAITQNERQITAEVNARKNGDNALSGRLTITERAITQEVTDRTNADSTLSGRIATEAGRITAEVTRAQGAESTLSGRLTITEGAITQEVTDRTNADAALSGRITTNANKVAIVVEEKNGQNVIKSASIVTAINNEGSSVAISADHVSITGDAKLSGSLAIEDGNLRVKKTAVFSGNVTLTTSGAYLQAPNLNVGSGGHLRLIGSGSGEYYDLTASNIQGFIKSASVANNVLTLTPVHGDPINFSKATTLTGAWGSGSDADKFIVTASPQGNQYKYAPPMRLNGSTAASNFSAEITETVGSTTSAKKSIYGYLIFNENGASSNVDVNTKSDGTGTAVARISVGSLYKPAVSDIGFDQLELKGSGTSVSGRTNAGSFRKSNLSAPGYIFFRVGCRGTNKLYYITVNT